MIKKETIIKIISVLSIVIICCCNQESESYFLKDKNNNTVEIIRNKDKLSIFEYDNSKKMELRDLVKINDDYFDDNVLERKRNDTNSYLFLSKCKKKYLVIDKHSLLNDSIIIGNKENEMYYTEIKSNEKPVNFKYYYNKNYEIKKITIKIGKKIRIYE
ncbi:MAG: hypothetical protein IM568_13190 [Flavobacterium sp.]|nr:hypothetical protein [Flavobacterium sp.]